MRNLKSLALLALLFSLSLVVFAETSNDATNAKEDVKPSTEATDAVEPQQRGGCRYGCCGAYAYGQCAACCPRPQTSETKVDANDVDVEPQALETEAVENNVVEPQQRGFGGGSGWGGGGRGGCKFGCCGGWRYGRCNYCCTRPQAETDVVDPEDLETETVEGNGVEPQHRGGGWGGGCRFGCCGVWRYGRCSYCCARPQAEADVVEAQLRRGCRYGCCGSYAHGQCSACCSKKMAKEEAKKKEEAKP